MAILNPDTKAAVNEIVQALRSAAGTNTTGGSNSLASKKLKSGDSLNRSIDSLSSRMTGLVKESDDYLKAQRRLNNITATNISQAGTQSRIAASMLQDLEKNATDISTVANKLPDAIRDAADKTLSGNAVFMKLVGASGARTAADFDRLSNSLNKAAVKSVSAIQNTIDSLETNSLADTEANVSLHDKLIAEEEMRQSLISLDVRLKKLGMTSFESARDLGRLNLTQLRGVFELEVKNKNLVAEAEKMMTEQLSSNAKAVAAATASAERVDKSWTRMAKSQGMEKILGKLGVDKSQVDEIRGSGGSTTAKMLSVLRLVALKAVTTVAVAAYNETKEIAKAAAETGVAPMAGAALQLRLSAAEFQRVLGKHAQAAFGGKEGITGTLKALNDNRDAFFRLTGDPEKAAALNMRAIEFTKSFTEGAQDVGSGSAQWVTHLNKLSVTTGQNADELMGLYESQMQSAEMQDVLLKLQGNEQISMVKTIQARTTEYTALGLSAERAVELAVGIEKMKAALVPDKIKEAGQLTRHAMQMGMDFQSAMRLGMLHRTKNTQDPEYIRGMKFVAKRETEVENRNSELIRLGLTNALALAEGEQEQNKYERSKAKLAETGPGINDALKGFREIGEAKGRDQSGTIEDRIGQKASDPYVKAGFAFMDASNIADAASRNMLGVAESFKDSVKLFGTAIGQLGAGVGNTASGLGSSTLGTAAVAGVGGLVAYKGAQLAGGALAGGRLAGAASGAAATVNAARLAMVARFAPMIPALMASPALLPILGGAAIAGTGYAVYKGYQHFTKAKPGGEPVSPNIPVNHVGVSADNFLEVQNAQNAQLVQLNKSISSLLALTVKGNEHNKVTSDATSDLATAFIITQQANLTRDMETRGRRLRNTALSGANFYNRSFS